jgi:hypothetical protein
MPSIQGVPTCVLAQQLSTHVHEVSSFHSLTASADPLRMHQRLDKCPQQLVHDLGARPPCMQMLCVTHVILVCL